MKNLTLAMVKPDAGENTFLISLYADRADFKVVAQKVLWLNLDQAEEFYAEHEGKPFFPDLCRLMSSGPVVVWVLKYLRTDEGAVSAWRRAIGATNPAEAEDGTIRKRFGKGMPNNAVHGSATPEDAEREISFFFSALELTK